MKKQDGLVMIIAVIATLLFPNISCTKMVHIKRINAEKGKIEKVDKVNAKQVSSPTLVSTAAPAIQSGNIPVKETIEYRSRGDKNKPPKSIAGKLNWNGKIWRRQIMLYNGACKNQVTPKMIDYVKGLTPKYLGSEIWEDYGNLLFGPEYYADAITPVAKAADVKKPAVPMIPKPAPAPSPAKPTKTPLVNSKLITTLKKLEQRYWQKEAESKIKSLGYSDVKDFQKTWKINVDGIVWTQTLKALEKAEKLNEKYQAAVKEMGWDSIKQFQEAFDLKPRGSADPETIKKIDWTKKKVRKKKDEIGLSKVLEKAGIKSQPFCN